MNIKYVIEECTKCSKSCFGCHFHHPDWLKEGRTKSCSVLDKYKKLSKNWPCFYTEEELKKEIIEIKLKNL